MPIDLDLFLSHTRGRSVEEVLLRGHLWVEKHVIALLEAELRRPEAMSLDRMPFAQKVKLADALGMLRPEEVEAVKVLNRMRNRLAHDLTGSPSEAQVDQFRDALPESQRSLAALLVATVTDEGTPPPEQVLARRLSAYVLALVTELEQHSQWHAYWREHRSALEGYDLMVAVLRRQGLEPESLEEYRRAVGIPDPPTGQDAVTYAARDNRPAAEPGG